MTEQLIPVQLGDLTAGDRVIMIRNGEQVETEIYDAKGGPLYFIHARKHYYLSDFHVNSDGTLEGLYHVFKR